MSAVLRILARAQEYVIDPDNLDLNSTDPQYIGRARKFCTFDKKCPMEWATIFYRPTMVGNLIYLLIFLALLGGQLWYGIRNKTWKYMSCLCLGIFGEAIGYVGRILLHGNPWIMNNFLVNLICLTISPALITAGIYLCLSRVITVVGSENSRMKPKMYTWVFVGADLLALVLQALGGGIAATAKDSKGSKQGTNIMIGGLISQVVTMALFFAIWLDFVLRVRRARLAGTLSRSQPPLYEALRSTRTFSLFQWSLFIASVTIFVRCVYRVAELWEGFSGHLANDEATFMIFEGPMIIIAVACMTAFHPGRVFGDLWVSAGNGVRSAKEDFPLADGAGDWKADDSYGRV
ncbi:RTA1-domain-containing protein [Aaosphaeria arxii CBS 175.79]|uniref:RTA1-domain-containing protein n=1 Tax=Aaosphaeria arxii CBS 175.79 TaxID=1450172 RepID=A0A6A5X7T1_9PLEO|nr:RTA1-domain-containing protein [Aaosphaeria arxii CBS 175.79]KAF2008814.1 RTA1-domain-containing protein [Aaosphaeria arxii CBS 175.79]